MPQDGTRELRWIISCRQDLLWFIGSAAAGYLALALLQTGFPLVPVQLFWLLGLDGPHVISTVTRTYFDKLEREKLGLFLWLPLPLMLPGPLFALAGLAPLFFLLAFCWQQFHVVKQHFGFMMIYKAKNKDHARVDFLLDRWFLLSSLFVPLALFFTQSFPQMSNISSVDSLVVVLLAGYGALGLTWLGRQFVRFRARVPVNWPKLALLAVVIPLQWVALLSAAGQGLEGTVRVAIALGLFHSLQYHRLMWFHNRNRYTQPGAVQRHGFAARLVPNAFVYFALAVGLHFVLMYAPTLVFPSQAVIAAVWGFSFTHFILDAKIWRVRSDRDLAVALRLA
jgi:hypothetical protein